jgi:hypothetical protein
MVLGLPLHVGGWWITNLFHWPKLKNILRELAPWYPPNIWWLKSSIQTVDGRNPVPVGRWFILLKRHIMIYRVCFMVNVLNYDYELLSSKLT